MRKIGTVYSFDCEKGYGHIFLKGWRNRLFFHAKNVEPDVIGRRNIPINSPVSFEVVVDEKGRDAAINVRNLDPELASVDPNEYAEYGQVKSWDGSVGYLIRPSKDTLRFTKRAIITEGAETIHAGTWLLYFIGRSQRDENQPVGFFARNVSVCTDPEPEPDDLEAHFLNAEELPLSYPEPVSVAVSVSESVLAPSTRKLTLFEIIKQRQSRN